MKDKTHEMNRGYSASEAECGYERINPSEVPTRRQYKDRQLGVAFGDDDGLYTFENYPNPEGDEVLSVCDEFAGFEEPGGFLPRNNTQERY